MATLLIRPNFFGPSMAVSTDSTVLEVDDLAGLID
jgi:hypothetical protein